jgi:hypothetical protein
MAIWGFGDLAVCPGESFPAIWHNGEFEIAPRRGFAMAMNNRSDAPGGWHNEQGDVDGYLLWRD